MDMSKLPRFSQSDAPTPDEATAPQAAVPVASEGRVPISVPPLSMAEIWVAAIVGFIFVALGRRFGSYMISLLARKPFHTGWVFPDDDPRAGQEVPYPLLQGHAMINDAGMFLFGVAVLFDAVVIATVTFSPRIRRPLLSLALLLTVAATIFNLYVAIVMFKDGIMPVFSLLAAALGGYAASMHWAMLRMTPGARRA